MSVRRTRSVHGQAARGSAWAIELLPAPPNSEPRYRMSWKPSYIDARNYGYQPGQRASCIGWRQVAEEFCAAHGLSMPAPSVVDDTTKEPTDDPGE